MYFQSKFLFLVIGLVLFGFNPQIALASGAEEAVDPLKAWQRTSRPLYQRVKAFAEGELAAAIGHLDAANALGEDAYAKRQTYLKALSEWQAAKRKGAEPPQEDADLGGLETESIIACMIACSGMQYFIAKMESPDAVPTLNFKTEPCNGGILSLHTGLSKATIEGNYTRLRGIKDLKTTFDRAFETYVLQARAAELEQYQAKHAVLAWLVTGEGKKPADESTSLSSFTTANPHRSSEGVPSQTDFTGLEIEAITEGARALDREIMSVKSAIAEAQIWQRDYDGAKKECEREYNELRVLLTGESADAGASGADASTERHEKNPHKVVQDLPEAPEYDELSLDALKAKTQEYQEAISAIRETEEAASAWEKSYAAMKADYVKTFGEYKAVREQFIQARQEAAAENPLKTHAVTKFEKPTDKDTLEDMLGVQKGNQAMLDDLKGNLEQIKTWKPSSAGVDDSTSAAAAAASAGGTGGEKETRGSVDLEDDEFEDDVGAEI